MGKPTGFLDYERKTIPYRDPIERVKDWKEVHCEHEDGPLQEQGARCMDCGIPTATQVWS